MVWFVLGGGWTAVASCHFAIRDTDLPPAYTTDTSAFAIIALRKSRRVCTKTRHQDIKQIHAITLSFYQ